MKYLAKNSQKLRKQALTIVSVGIATAALVVGGLLLFVPREYSSEISLLVVQKYTLTDPYTAAKSAEKISQNLAAVVHTSSFFEEVVRTTWVDLSSIETLPEDEKRDAWKRKITTTIDSGTSIITLTGYDVDPANAERLVQAASTALLEHGANYHGAPDTVSLRVVDTALTSSYPTRPNLIVNGGIAGLAGMILAALVIFLGSSTPFSAQPLQTAANPTVAPRPKQPQVDMRALKKAEKEQIKQKKQLERFQEKKLQVAEKEALAVRAKQEQEALAAEKREQQTIEMQAKRARELNKKMEKKAKKAEAKKKKKAEALTMKHAAEMERAKQQKQIAVELNTMPQPDGTAHMHMEQVTPSAEYAVLDVMNFTTHIPKHIAFKAVTVQERVQSLPEQHLPQLPLTEQPA